MTATRQDGEGRLGETEIIARLFAPLAKEVDGAFALTDDAARLAPAEGAELVLSTDMLVEGVHFRRQDSAEAVGWKALAVNVSDLVAKGAEPMVYLLALALPKAPERAWLDGLARGLGEAQAAFGCRLTGGDTTATPGPVTLSVTAIGSVPAGAMVARAGARVGDRVYVTGSIGDAALGLHVLDGGDAAARLDPDQRRWLVERYLRPRPPVPLVPALRAHASAAMDISDGLAGDFTKLCAVSGTGGTLRTADVPLSDAGRAAVDIPGLLETVVTGGDDYEVLAAVPEDRAAAFEAAAAKAGVPVAPIGCIRPAAEGVTILAPDGAPLHFTRGGYDHF